MKKKKQEQSKKLKQLQIRNKQSNYHNKTKEEAAECNMTEPMIRKHVAFPLNSSWKQEMAVQHVLQGRGREGL